MTFGDGKSHIIHLLPAFNNPRLLRLLVFLGMQTSGGAVLLFVNTFHTRKLQMARTNINIVAVPLSTNMLHLIEALAMARSTV